VLSNASGTGHTGVEDRFLRWLQDEGGEAMRTKHLRFAEFSGSGRGLQALEPLAVGEPIVSVPRHLHMTSHDAWETFGAAGIDLGGVRPTGCEALAMLLMREAGDGLAGLPGGGGGGGSSSSSAEKAAAAAAAAGGAALSGDTGRWAPYVATLPRPSSMSGDVRGAGALPQVPALLLKAMAEEDHHRTASAEAAKAATASSASSALGGGAAASGAVGALASLGADVAHAAAQGNALFSVLEKSPTTRNVLAHRLQRFEARAAELEDRLWRHHPPAAFGLGGEGGGGSSATSAEAAGGSAADDGPEPAPWEVELAKPAPERRQALWRWASAMVSSRAWRGEIGSDGGAWGAWQHKTTKGQRKTADGGVGCSLVPLADMLNHKAGAGALQFKQQQQQQQQKTKTQKAGGPVKAAEAAAAGAGVAQVLAARPYRAGEQLHDSYVAQANATAEPECNVYLFYNFGFVEGNSGGGEAAAAAAAAAAAPRDCAFVDLAIPEKLLGDERARRVLTAHGFLAPGAENGGAREKFTLRGGGGGGGGGGLPVRLLQLMRLLAASEDEMAVEDARAEEAAPQPLAPQQLSVTNELRVLRQIERALDGFLEGFGDSAKADAAAAAHALAAAREVQPADSGDNLAAQAAQGTLLARATALHLRAGEQRALRRAADGLAEHWSRLYWQAGLSYVLVPSATLLVGAVVMKLTQS
jgi:hypothetical protein